MNGNTRTPILRAVLAIGAILACIFSVHSLTGWPRLASPPRLPAQLSAGMEAPLLGKLALPRTMLWAWERPEDLAFLDPSEAGVAFLAGTVTLSDRVIAGARLQSLRVSPRTALIAVVRIESSSTAGLSAQQRSSAAAAIIHLAAIRRVSAVQIDYDARLSERAFYRDLLFDVRARLPRTIPLSITALASWCLGDRWLAGLPVDEAVPMMFRMGPSRASVLQELAAAGDFREPACRSSIGLSTDEPVRAVPSGRRVYVFHPKPWSADAVRKALSFGGVRHAALFGEERP